MRVEPTNAELRGTDVEIEPSGGRATRFRKVMRRQRRANRHRETSAAQHFPLLGNGQSGTPTPAPAPSGCAPARSINRVEHAGQLQSLTPRIAAIQATIVVPGRETVDMRAIHGPEGVLVSLMAAPVIAERLLKHTGTLGRRLSVREVRTRMLRVQSTAPGTPSRNGGSAR